MSTGIEWTDVTWNCIRGCTRVSEGCRHCYAERTAGRFSGPGQPYEGLAVRRIKVISDDEQRMESRWTGDVSFVTERLADPLKWKKPRRVFVNSMSDLFHEKLLNEQIAAVFGVMAACPQHTFQCLTKRPARMRAFLTHPEARTWIARAKDAALVEHEHKHPETWRSIHGFDGYHASSHGRIRNSDGKVLQQQLNAHEQIGRYSVSIYKSGNQTTQFVHRLVLFAFAGEPREGEEACHRNGIKTDNRSANLRWGTRSENQREKVRHGARGGPAKLTTEQVATIRERRAAGETQQSVADAFAVSRSLVSMIESGAVWGEPDIPWPLPNVWLGVSVENQAAADERIPELLRTPAAVRSVSCEPLLGPVDLTKWLGDDDVKNQEGRGIRLLYGEGGRVGDRRRGEDLASSEAERESMGRPSDVDPRGPADCGPRGRGRLSERAGDGERQENDGAFSSSGVAPLSWSDSGRHDGEPQERHQVGQPAREPRSRERLGAADSRESGARNGVGREPNGGTQPIREGDDGPGDRDPNGAGIWRNMRIDRGEIRDHVPTGLGNRSRAESIHWIISGCESGPGARPCDVDWLRSLRNQCAEAGVAFFLKQARATYPTWESWKAEQESPETGGIASTAPTPIAQGPGSKRKAGGIIGAPYLDGVQHLEFPKVEP